MPYDCFSAEYDGLILFGNDSRSCKCAQLFRPSQIYHQPSVCAQQISLCTNPPVIALIRSGRWEHWWLLSCAGNSISCPPRKDVGQLKETAQSSSNSTELRTGESTHRMRLIHQKHLNEMEACCDVWHCTYKYTVEKQSHSMDKTYFNTFGSRTFGCSEPPAFSNRG